MKKAVIAVLIVSITISCIIPIYAIGFTYDQIIDMIDAVAVDGVKMFTDSRDGTVSPDEKEAFFSQTGAALVWLGDIEQGIFFLFDNDSSKMHLWNKVDVNNIRYTFEILLPVLDSYIDYKNGGKVTLILTNNQAFTKPFAKIEYSPNIKSAYKTDSGQYNEYYDDEESFKDAINKWFRVALDNEGIEIADESSPKPEHNNGFSKPIIRGTKGKEVERLQTQLKQMSYSIGIDKKGLFGHYTANAVRQFQMDNGLKITGSVNKDTYYAIENAEKETLQKGSKGDEVKRLQKRLSELKYLSSNADGEYGEKTKEAIEAFQKNNDIDVSGIADLKTKELLFSSSAKKSSAKTTPISNNNSSSSGGLSAERCESIATNYVKTKYPGVNIITSSVNIEGNYAYVGMSLSGGTVGLMVIVVVVNKQTGSIEYIETAS